MKSAKLATLLVLVGVIALLIGTAHKKPITSVVINATTIPVEVADEPQERQKGLSGRLMLAQDAGVLFMFDKADYHSFWMKDMRFPIDIIWIDERAVIVDITPAVPPPTGNHVPLYYPKKPVRYVLEVNAGFAEEHKINIGDVVKW